MSNSTLLKVILPDFFFQTLLKLADFDSKLLNQNNNTSTGTLATNIRLC